MSGDVFSCQNHEGVGLLLAHRVEASCAAKHPTRIGQLPKQRTIWSKMSLGLRLGNLDLDRCLRASESTTSISIPMLLKNQNTPVGSGRYKDSHLMAGGPELTSRVVPTSSDGKYKP